MLDENFHRKIVSAIHDPDELREISWVKKRFDPQDEARALLERQWRLNSAFVKGMQWYDWDSSRWTLVPTPSGGRRHVREQRNFCRPHVRREVALLTGFTPAFKVRPATRDMEDQQAARVGSKVCQGYWDQLRMDLLAQRLAVTASVKGHAFLKCGWDATKGESFEGPAINQETGEVIIREDTGAPEMALYFEGDFRTEVLGPDTVYVDPYVKHDEEIQWIMEMKNVPIETIENAYPDKARYVADVTETFRRGVRADHIYHGWGSLAGSEQESNGWVTKYEFYHHPTPNMPRGRKIVIAGNILLESSDNPCMDRRNPYISFRKVLVDDQFWGDTELTDMISPQRNYNRIRSKKLEHAFLFGTNMKLDWPSTAGNPETVFMTGVGEILKRRGRDPIQYLQIPPLPPDADNEAQQIRIDLDDIAGTYAVEKGQFPGKASGVAMDLLNEQGMKKNTPDLIRWAAGYEQWGRMLLFDLQRYAPEERIVKIQGRHEQFDVQAFSAADFRGNTDVHIEVGSVVPKSRRMTLTEINEMIGSGMLNMQDPAQRAKAFQMLEMEDPSILSFDKDRHRRVASQEYSLAKRGVDPGPHQIWHDLEAHVMQHFEDVDSDDFKTWEPEAQQLFFTHIQDTLAKAMPVAGATVTPDQAAPMEQEA